MYEHSTALPISAVALLLRLSSFMAAFTFFCYQLGFTHDTHTFVNMDAACARTGIDDSQTLVLLLSRWKC